MILNHIILIIESELKLLAVLDKRRRQPIEKQDLLNVMLNNNDSKTGESMSDKSIINNVSAHGDLLRIWWLSVAHCDSLSHS